MKNRRSCVFAVLLGIVSSSAFPAELMLDGFSLNIPDGVKVIDAINDGELVFVYTEIRPANIISIQKIEDETEKMWGCKMADMMHAIFSVGMRESPCSKKIVEWMRSTVVDGAEVQSGQTSNGGQYYIACKPSDNCAVFVYGGGIKGGYMILSNFLRVKEARSLVEGNGTKSER